MSNFQSFATLICFKEMSPSILERNKQAQESHENTAEAAVYFWTVWPCLTEFGAEGLAVACHR